MWTHDFDVCEPDAAAEELTVGVAKTTEVWATTCPPASVLVAKTVEPAAVEVADVEVPMEDELVEAAEDEVAVLEAVAAFVSVAEFVSVAVSATVAVLVAVVFMSVFVAAWCLCECWWWYRWRCQWW